VFVQADHAEPISYCTVLQRELTITNQHFALTIRVGSAWQIIGKIAVVHCSYDDLMETGVWDTPKDHLGAAGCKGCGSSLYNGTTGIGALPVSISVAWESTAPSNRGVSIIYVYSYS
jgi:hypothetical protein